MALQRYNSISGGSTSNHSSKPRLTPRMSASSLSSPSSTSVTSALPTSPASPSRSSHLVALRYEETVQAKPPIMVTKRSSSSVTSSSAYLARSRSTLSTRSLATTASSRLSAATTSSTSMPLLSPSISPASASTPSPSPSPSTSTPTSTRYPLVILRPPGLVMPPTEQHPALRTPTFHPIVEEGGEASEEAAEITAAAMPRLRATVPDKGTDLCKRDSILASSAASTVSLWPEDVQEAKEEEEDVNDDSAVNATKDANVKDAKDIKEEAHEAQVQHAEDEDEEDDGYASCMCRSASRRSKVVSGVSVVCPAPVREAPPPPAEKANAATVANEENSVVSTSATAATSRMAPVEIATMSVRSSLEAGPAGLAAADALSTSTSVTREKSWRLPRTSFSFRASTFQRNSKKKKRSASLDLESTPTVVPPPSTPVQYEDGLIPVVVPGTTAHENEHENRSMGEGRTTGPTGTTTTNHILPAFTAQSPLLPAGPFQFSAAPTAPSAPTDTVPPHQRHYQHARLSKPNPSWPPMLASQPPSQQSQQAQEHAPPSACSASIAPSCLPLGTNLPPPSMPLPSISSFASFPTPSLPNIPAIVSSPLPPASPPPPSPRTPPAQPHFFLRVLSMSDSRQKRQQQHQQHQDRDADASPKREKDTKKVTKREREKSIDVDHLPSTTPLINTAIPTERLLEDDFLQSLTFSKRGSLMFGGKRAVVASSSAASFAPLSSPLALPPMDLPPLAPAVERESLQVRSLYASGPAWDAGRPPSIAVSGVIAEEAEPEECGRRGETSAAVSNSLQNDDTPLPEPQEPQEPQQQPTEQPQESQEPQETAQLPQPQATTPDVSSLSIAPAPTDHLRPDAAARATASNNDARTSIISATSATTASTGIALTEGTESSLSLVPTTTPQPSGPPSPFDAGASTNSNTNSTTSPTSPTSPIRNAYELAGGLEDWEDVDVADVDRFGFIHVRRPRPGTAVTTGGGDGDGDADADADDDADEQTVNGNNSNGNSSGGRGLTGGIGRHFSRRHRSPSARRRNNRTLTSNTGNGFGARSVHTSRSTSTTATAAAAARSSIRAAANQLPHNKDRRWIDEAGEMLTLEPGLADIAEDEDAEHLADMLKRKEWERAEKWRRMAKTVQRNEDGAATGAGMDFEFDLQHPKLVKRTWKGIPDRWRAPAWYSFLASSAQRRRAQRVPPLPAAVPTGEAAAAAAPLIVAAPAAPDGGETDTQIIAAFHRLQDTASPDDVQIDLDVPRTVNGHVMFRKRYRGGQRLLFRVLHALSLYFHATGYVQGMASLAATLLCYYDEERCFVMLVRLFHLRGLERLYEPGFGGLMEALGEFEQQWLARSNRRVAPKLTALNIDATTYATRWYLTLFNLSVPFPAQLRIWDVFMLLGDADDLLGSSASSRPGTRSSTRPGTAATTRPSTAVTDAGIPPPEMTATAMITASAPAPTASKANLAVLHATSTALIDGLQEVLLDADFENAMKAVTSWVPIKDVDLLMKVVHAEWKRYQKRKARR